MSVHNQIEKIAETMLAAKLLPSRVSVLLALVILSPAQPATAQFVAERLTETSQLNPEGLPVLAATNMVFNGQPSGIEGSVSGVEFEDVVWGTETKLSNGVMAHGSVAGGIRTANVLSSVNGDGAEILAGVANSINYYNVNTDGTFTLTDLPPELPVQVQMITSDAAGSANNWGGSFSLTVFDTTTQESVSLGSFEAGTEPDNLDAQIVTFETTSDSDGVLQIGIDQTRGGQHAGVGAVVVYLLETNIVGIRMDSVDFSGGIAEGEVVGKLSADDQRSEARHSYELVSGIGGADNEKFVVAGDELRSKGHDFSSARDMMTYSLRVRAFDIEIPERFLDVVIELTVHCDADGDRLWDGWELSRTNPDSLTELDGDGIADADGDTLSDWREFELSLGDFPNINPLSADTDEDGLQDADELIGAGARPPTDPTIEDTDEDGLGDGVETATGVFIGESDTGSDPSVADTDGDGIIDGDEVNGKNLNGFRSDPNRKDSDGDGFGDAEEIGVGSDPLRSGDVPDFSVHQLTDTSQLNPAGLEVLAAANMIFGNQPPGIGGPVNGVEFEDVVWGSMTLLSTGASVEGTVAGSTRTANILGTLSGENADVLAAVANSINYYNVNTDGTITITDLPAGLQVQVQMITSDAASSFNNWGGVFSLSVVDTMTQESVVVGSFDAGTEPNNFDAQLATFGALVDGGGTLQIFINQTRGGHHAGIGGVVIFAAGLVQPLQITSLVFDAAEGSATIEWNSSARKIYAVDASEDLIIWEELDDNVTSNGEATSFTDTDVPFDSRKRFYRVQELER